MTNTNNARQIRFRVWDGKKFTKENAGGEVLSITFNGKIQGHYYDDITIYPEGEYAIQQFTGLLDKNGKEIYEGDFLSLGQNMFEIYYDSLHAAFCGRSKTAFAQAICFYSHTSLNLTENDFLYEVIGNIFENPELIQSK